MLEGEQALSSGMVDALEIDVSSARHRTRLCASIAHSGGTGTRNQKGVASSQSKALCMLHPLSRVAL